MSLHRQIIVSSEAYYFQCKSHLLMIPTPPAAATALAYARRRRNSRLPTSSTSDCRALFTVWLVGRAGRRMCWTRPPPSRPPRIGPDWRAVRRPAGGRIGWADARAGPNRPTYAREKAENKRRRERPVRRAGSRQRAGQGRAGVAGAGLENEGAGEGWHASSTAQTETGTSGL